MTKHYTLGIRLYERGLQKWCDKEKLDKLQFSVDMNGVLEAIGLAKTPKRPRSAGTPGETAKKHDSNSLMCDMMVSGAI